MNKQNLLITVLQSDVTFRFRCAHDDNYFTPLTAFSNFSHCNKAKFRTQGLLLPQLLKMLGHQSTTRHSYSKLAVYGHCTLRVVSCCIVKHSCYFGSCEDVGQSVRPNVTAIELLKSRSNATVQCTVYTHSPK